MGLFSSSWKYYAFAATTPLFDDETDYPHTFQKVLLQGLAAGDDFSNLLRYTLTTDMYARAKAMVRYAKREVDPYIRGLPTSNLVVRGGHKNWIENAILREIKMPLEDFFWLRFGTFDANYVGCKFIHDHYMDIEYFPWPNGCLPDIKNPNFDNGEEFWILDDFIIDGTARVAEMTSDGGTLYSEMVGEVNPGDIISLRATCCRGSNDPAQTGQINITFYDSGGTEISTFSATNSTTPADEWELLTVIATAPAGSATAKAWAGGTMGVDTRLQVEEVLPDGANAYAQLNFYPFGSVWPDVNLGFEFAYDSGSYPNQWMWSGVFTETEHTDYNQIYIKATLDTRHSGVKTPIFTEGGGSWGTWLDLWDDWIIEASHFETNGIREELDATISIAKDDGAGSPDLSTVQTFPVTFLTYKGKKEFVLIDALTNAGGTGDLVNRTVPTDRRAWDGAGPTTGYQDLFYNTYGTYDYGWISVPASGFAYSRAGDVTNEAMYVIDSNLTDFRYAALMGFGSRSSGGVAAGLVFRAKDLNNFWYFGCLNPEATDPVVGFYKVVSGTHTLALGMTLTGKGPLDASGDKQDFRITCVGNKITGTIYLDLAGGASGTPQYIPENTITLTDAYLNTETNIGFWAEDIDAEFGGLSICPWPLGAVNWDIFVWDSTPKSGHWTDCGNAWCMFYVYEGSNTKTAHPYHSSYSIDDGDYDNNTTYWGSVVNWRLTSFGSEIFLAQVETLSGDTDKLEIWEYGTTLRSSGVWMDAFRLMVGIWRKGSPSGGEGAGTNSATFRVRFAVDDGTGTFGSWSPLSGTETVWKTITLTATSTGPCT